MSCVRSCLGLRLCDLDAEDRTNALAGGAENAVFFTNGSRFLGRSRVSRSLLPVKNVYRAGVDAGAVGDAEVIIHRHGGAVNTQLGGRIHRAPYVVSAAFAFTNDGAVLHKIGINWCYHETSS